jgi:1,4-dihydroxy-2-naphthoate octaprenyltransferase
MRTEGKRISRLRVYFLAARPAFLTAAAAPVLVGSTLGFAVSGEFSVVLFLLALFGMVFLQGGSNIINDYFDHISGNDPANKNPTPFSGGSRVIQHGLMSPRAAFCEGVILLAAAGVLGIIIIILTRSVFILSIGIIGVLGAFFYSARPIKLCYRTLGEITIAFLFGILPVTGSYFLQSGVVDYHVIPAAVIMSLLIFLIILVNEFPDVEPDAAVEKKTIVVRFGVSFSAAVYRVALILTYLTAVASFFDRVMFYPAVAYLFTLPLGIKIFRLANKEQLVKDVTVNALTVRIHILGAVALTAGFIIYRLTAGQGAFKL